MPNVALEDSRHQKGTFDPQQPDVGETLRSLYAGRAEVGLLERQGKPDAAGEGEGRVAAGDCELLNV